MLAIISYRNKHNVKFDNFITSHKLLWPLSEKGYFATGSVCDYRTDHAPLEDFKSMKKKDRGSSDFRFDKNNSIIAVRWNDNSVNIFEYMYVYNSTLLLQHSFLSGGHCDVEFFGFRTDVAN